MNITPHPWRQPTLARDTAPDARPAFIPASAKLPLDADLSALLAHDDTLLGTLSEQCRIRGLYIVHNGHEIKVSPHIEPGWRVVVENDKNRAKVAA